MKKTALTILLTALTVATGYAQGAYDAWLFSENNYEGTARTVAIGNAFTALGGDLGAVSINPAGSAVAGYSQFALTPSLTVSSSTAGGALPPNSSNLPYFDKTHRSGTHKWGIPNLGMSFNFKTGRHTGLKNITVGFIANRSNTWCEDVYAAGTNYTTSFAGAAADDATENIAWHNEYLPAGEPRYSHLDFTAENAYEYYNPWKDIIGYRSGIFSQYDEAGEKFIGATEILYDNGSIQQGGPLYQTYGRNVNGLKDDYIFNIGANISDFVYLGFSLGMTSLTYDYTEYFKESAEDESNFENVFSDSEGNKYTTYFHDLTYKYNYSASGFGVYGKFGVIVTPGDGLRLGAAIQTPTSTTIDEQWQESGATNFSDSQFNGNATSPLGEARYTFYSPLRANFGVAYTMNNLALFSVDYEVAAYNTMKYQIDRYNMSDADIEYLNGINEDIRNAYGPAHQLRIGAELKPSSMLAVRAGYNLRTSAQTKYYDESVGEYVKNPYSYGHNVSAGLGFISKGSFFADIACRYTFRSKEYYMPYNDYQFDGNGEITNYAPEILIDKRNWKVYLTLGWRF